MTQNISMFFLKIKQNGASIKLYFLVQDISSKLSVIEKKTISINKLITGEG